LPWLGLLFRNESLPEGLTFGENEAAISAQLGFPHGPSDRRPTGASFYASAAALGVATVVIEPRIRWTISTCGCSQRQKSVDDRVELAVVQISHRVDVLWNDLAAAQRRPPQLSTMRSLRSGLLIHMFSGLSSVGQDPTETAEPIEVSFVVSTSGA